MALLLLPLDILILYLLWQSLPTLALLALIALGFYLLFRIIGAIVALGVRERSR